VQRERTPIRCGEMNESTARCRRGGTAMRLSSLGRGTAVFFVPLPKQVPCLSLVRRRWCVGEGGMEGRARSRFVFPRWRLLRSRLFFTIPTIPFSFLSVVGGILLGRDAECGRLWRALRVALPQPAGARQFSARGRHVLCSFCQGAPLTCLSRAI